ncbi:MAG: hypothetical protein RLZZ306_2691 [Bacteroidota bacterium]|jgi:membrane protease YdiL (CAAX protease family)
MLIIKSLVEALCQLLILTVFFVCIKPWNKANNAVKFFLLFCLLYLIEVILLQNVKIPFPYNLQKNWSGKMASLCWALIFIFTNKVLAKQDIGWTFKIANKKVVFLSIGILLFVQILLKTLVLGGNGQFCDLETFFYQATMPGFAEEIVYRGIFLGLLNKIFLSKWTFLSVTFGWGLILSSILFGLAHGLYFDKTWIVHFDFPIFIQTFFMGIIFGILKEKSKSLIPSIIYHNLSNLVIMCK